MCDKNSTHIVYIKIYIKIISHCQSAHYFIIAIWKKIGFFFDKLAILVTTLC